MQLTVSVNIFINLFVHFAFSSTWRERSKMHCSSVITAFSSKPSSSSIFTITQRLLDEMPHVSLPWKADISFVTKAVNNKLLLTTKQYSTNYLRECCDIHRWHAVIFIEWFNLNHDLACVLINNRSEPLLPIFCYTNSLIVGRFCGELALMWPFDSRKRTDRGINNVAI